MTPKDEDFLPIANHWFSPTLEYVGRCKAEFSSPRGSIEGLATVTVDEAGKVSVEMSPEPESLRTERPLRYGLIRFFGGDGFVQEQGGGIGRIDPFSQNPCTRLEVKTPHGTFRTEDVLYYGTDSVLDTGEAGRATFALGLSAFEADNAGDPEYWVLPLANFLSECRERRPELDRHPLRVFPTPEVPDEITHVPHGPDEEKAKWRAISALSAANSKNNLIVFEFGVGLGFVERLPDYAEGERLLLEGKERSKTTAVMVGPTGGEPAESFERMLGWFPFDVLSLLTLATGTEVGCPWVEIRDGEGRLERRLHRRLGIRPFRKGRRLMEDIPMQYGREIKGTGRLIECACSRSKKFGQTYVRAAIVHLTRARYEDQTLDDSMTHLTRGLDSLCKRYGTAEQIPNESLNEEQRRTVRGILDDAARRIEELISQRQSENDAESLAALHRIGDRARSAAQNKDRGFGLAVIKLMGHFGLPDAEILEGYYRDLESSWGRLLSHYRGDVIHHGYLDILEAGHDWEEIAAIRDHLHDALARVVLKILEFDGGYRPSCVPHPMVPQPVDWVQSNLPAQALGYKESAGGT